MIAFFYIIGVPVALYFFLTDKFLKEQYITRLKRKKKREVTVAILEEREMDLGSQLFLDFRKDS